MQKKKCEYDNREGSGFMINILGQIMVYVNNQDEAVNN